MHPSHVERELQGPLRRHICQHRPAIEPDCLAAWPARPCARSPHPVDAYGVVERVRYEERSRSLDPAALSDPVRRETGADSGAPRALQIVGWHPGSSLRVCAVGRVSVTPALLLANRSRDCLKPAPGTDGPRATEILSLRAALSRSSASTGRSTSTSLDHPGSSARPGKGMMLACPLSQGTRSSPRRPRPATRAPTGFAERFGPDPRS